MLIVLATLALQPVPAVLPAVAVKSDCRTPYMLMSADAAQTPPRQRREQRARPAQRPCLTLATATV